MHEIDLQPTLVGERVTIRPLRADDWEAMFAAAADPKIWEVHPVRDRYTEPVFRQFFDGALASNAAFAFVDSGSDAICGSSRYHGYEPERSEIEIGWTFLDRAHWGGAFNAEVKRLMLRHAFRFVETVIFVVGEGNLRSRRAMEKIGGVRREGLVSRVLNGVTYEHVVYEIRRADFETGPLCR